jgi:hypothetical protein
MLFNSFGVMICQDHFHEQARAKTDQRKHRRARSDQAEVRQEDADAILASQAATFSTGTMVIATGNPRHLSRFVPAEHWSDIEP